MGRFSDTFVYDHRTTIAAALCKHEGKKAIPLIKDGARQGHPVPTLVPCYHSIAFASGRYCSE